MARITKLAKVGAGTGPRPPHSQFTDPSSPLRGKKLVLVLVKLSQGCLLMGTCSCFAPSVGEAMKRFRGSEVIPCQLSHGLCTIC